MSTRTGVDEIDRWLQALSDQNLDAPDARDEAVTATIDEAIRSVRTQGRH